MNRTPDSVMQQIRPIETVQKAERIYQLFGYTYSGADKTAICFHGRTAPDRERLPKIYGLVRRNTRGSPDRMQ